MFKALLLKHLKQARIVVVTGMAFTLAIPLLAGLLVGVVWGGQTPGGPEFPERRLGVPLMAGHLWPLWMMLITSRSSPGTKACGADTYGSDRSGPALCGGAGQSPVSSPSDFFLISFLGWWLGVTKS